ncbi:MAG TPA: tetratricopeptide repeat protein [Kofleriaceae bacterium]|jgi:tetratricopeptide (TPR) repeat protein|nr:tetratricopeptide repeat protein [Kofleriaceae bacterium]
MRTSGWVTALFAIAAASAPASAQRPNQGEDESAALVNEGRAAVRRGEFDTAAKALDQAIALNPRRIEAYVLRSAVYWTRKQYKEGVQLMRRAQLLAPADEEVLTALGSHLVRAGDPAAGVPLLEQVIAADPRRYDAEIILGDHRYAAGKWAGAITAFEGYFAHRPPGLAAEDARHRVDLADAYLRDHQAAKALAAFQQAASEAAGSKAGAPDLRTRLGVAWATAALDCKKARGLLRELESVAANHPEVWLVDGRCALALGDPATAIERGQRYLGRAGRSAAGHALVGEAYEQRGNVAEARRELEVARDLEPGRRSWTVKLASVVRRGGDPRAAIGVLDQLGAPRPAAADPDWWAELGLALFAADDAPQVIARLTPALEALPADAALRALVARAQLAAGQVDDAVKTLEPEVETHSPRAQKLFAGALAAVAVAKLADGAALAEAMLARAVKLDGSAAIWRDLGIARLASDRAADAVDALDAARQLEPAPATLMLYARARALTGDAVGARPFYDQALAAARGEAAEVAIDWAASELAGGDPAIAVTALEKTAAQARGPLAQRHKAALAEARHAAGIAALRAGNGAKAVELIKAAAAVVPSLAAQCDLALAEVVAGDTAGSFTALKAVAGKSCPFPPPADVQAVPILTAFIDGLNPRRARAALERLTALAGKATGAAAGLRDAALHAVALEAASDAYRGGNLGQARAFLTAASRANARKNADEVALDLALVDVADGKLDAAIGSLQRLAGRLPDALVALGIAYERKGDPQKALEAWRAARRAGSRFAPLAGWIDAKERFFGGAP